MLFALLLLTLAGQSPAAAISGRVTEQASGRPLPRMVVTLVTADPSKQVEAVTDADGRYEFTGLAPGRYASPPLTTTPIDILRQWFGETDPAPPFGGPPRLNIELKTGDVRSGWILRSPGRWRSRVASPTHGMRHCRPWSDRHPRGRPSPLCAARVF
jgi:hypothetical protein